MLFVLTRFTCGGQRIGILCGFVAVAAEWLITHHCLLSILDGLGFVFGKMFQQGDC